MTVRSGRAAAGPSGFAHHERNTSVPHPPPESTPQRIDRFRGAFAFLSNFHRAPFTWCGHTWPTSEAAFQAGKTRDEPMRERIRTAASPAEAKRLGRRVDLRPDWDRIKDDVMHSVLRAKFAVPELRDALLATGDAELVEGNSWATSTGASAPAAAGTSSGAR